MQIVLQSAVAVNFSLIDITDYHQLEPMASNFTLIIPLTPVVPRGSPCQTAPGGTINYSFVFDLQNPRRILPRFLFGLSL